MSNLKARLLDHLNAGKKLFEFPGIKPLASLDLITDGLNLVTLPQDKTAHLLERVQVNTRQSGIVGVLGHTNGYSPSFDLIYNFKEAKFELREVPINSGIGLITDTAIEQERVYQLE